MKKLILITTLIAASNAFADSSIQVTGALQELKGYAGTSIYRIVSDIGNAYVLAKKDAKSFGKCKKGNFEIVADNPVAPRYYVLVGGECQKR